MKRYSPLLMLLVLLGALAASQAATAASPARPTPTFAHPTLRDNPAEFEEEEFEAEEDEFEFEECEASAGEFEFETGEEFEEEELEASCGDEGATAKVKAKGAPFVTAPAACQVRQAESTITTLPDSDQVRLTVRYETYAPTQVTVGLKLEDRKGSVAIEHTTKHMGGKGVLHITTKLGTAVMERASTASEFDVSLRAPETPGFCAGALEQQLHSVKHTDSRAPRVYSD
jgi:hypothetical protein